MSPAAEKFHTLGYQLHLVLRWMSWMDFRHGHPFTEQPVLIDTFDRYQCCMAITALKKTQTAVCSARIQVSLASMING